MKYKNNLFQYDQNQTITNVDGLFVDYILNDETLRVPVVDGNAIIPNEVLAVAGMHYAYVCLANETRLEFRFKVTARVAPPDVPYAPSHAITFDDLVKTVQDEVKSLEERAASGEFDGKDGQDYVITPADYDAIAERVTLEGVVKTVNHVAPDAEGNVDVQGGGETTDVQLNGVSITKDGVANIPVAGETLGVVKVQSNGVYGIESVAGGHVAIKSPTTKDITDRAPYKAVTLDVLDDAVSTSLNKPKKTSPIDTWASARKNMKAQTEFTAGTNLEWVEEQTTLGKKYTLNAAGYDDTEIKGQIEALDGSVVKTVNGVAPVDGNVDVQGGGSSVTMADNAQGGVDLTVDGSTKTLAKEGELATIKADLSLLATKTATSEELGMVKVSSSYGLSLLNGTIFAENLLPVSYNSKNNYTVISKGTLENVLDNASIRVDKTQTLTDAQKAQARANIGVGGKFELIEELILAEDTTRITKSSEPNGTPYRFTKIMITMENEPDVAGAVYFKINDFDAFYVSNGTYTVKRYVFFKGDCSDGVLDCSGIASSAITSSASYDSVFGASTVMCDLITKFIVSNIGGTFKANSKIKIYGIRA